MNNILDCIKRLDLERILWIEEHLDPQFLSARKIVENAGSSTGLRLLVGNSLICYQLSGKGEAYWQEFADYVASGGRKISEFLMISRNNKRLRNIKLSRLNRYSKLAASISSRIGFLELWRLLGAEFGLENKTTVFAVKMFGYGLRNLGIRSIFPMEIPLPVDSRVKNITSSLSSEKPKDFWNKVSKRTGLPPLHLDSVIWNWNRISSAGVC